MYVFVFIFVCLCIFDIRIPCCTLNPDMCKIIERELESSISEDEAFRIAIKRWHVLDSIDGTLARGIVDKELYALADKRYQANYGFL